LFSDNFKIGDLIKYGTLNAAIASFPFVYQTVGQISHTTIHQVTQLQAPPIFNLQGNFGRQPQRWISRYWTMLSLVGGELILLDGGAIAFERPGYSDALLTHANVPTLCSHEYDNGQGIQGW